VRGLRSNFTAYDACYVALAESLDADMLTADERLASATPTLTAVAVLW
jgi:predicted nucleic acid-binding protein